MHTYFVDAVRWIDCAVALLLILLGLFIIIYEWFQEFLEGRRNRALLAIKKNVYKLVASGRKDGTQTCVPFIIESTVRQLVDVQTNRRREFIFFNDAEKELFRSCFVTPEKVAQLEYIAKRSRSKWRRIEAILGLGYAHTETTPVMRILAQMARDRDADIAYFSLVALGQIRTKESAHILLDLLRRNAFSRSKIVSLLESFPADIVDDAIALADDPDPGVRFWAVKLLSRFTPERFFRKVEELTADTSADVRAAACECLGLIKRVDARDILLRALTDDAWFVRMYAVRALDRCLGAAALGDIVGCLKDNSWYVIWAARDALTGHIEEALPYMAEIFAGKDKISRMTSVEALENAGYVKTVLADLFAADPKRRVLATALLKGMVEERARFGLGHALGALDEAIRTRVIAVMRELDAPFTDEIVAQGMVRR